MTTDSNDLTWRCITSPAEFLQLKTAWESLFSANPEHSPFLAWGWLSAWLNHLAGLHTLQVFLLEDASGTIQVAVPMVCAARPDAGGRLKLMNACGYGADCSDHLGCLYRPEHEPNLVKLVTAGISALTDPKLRVELRSLDGRDNLPVRLLDGFSQGGRSARLSWKHRCPQMTLPTTWDDLLTTLSRNFRSQVRRNIKAIATSSDLKIRQLQSSEAQTFTENLIRLNRHRMGNTGRVSSLEDENFRTFLIEAVQYMAEANIAWMDVVEDQNEIVAGSLNFIHGKSIYYYMGGFSEHITKMGPGNALFAQAIQRGIENGYERFDFLRGAESYKYRWGSKDVIDQDLIVYPRGIVRGGIQRATDVSRLFVRRARSKLSAFKRDR